MYEISSIFEMGIFADELRLWQLNRSSMLTWDLQYQEKYATNEQRKTIQIFLTSLLWENLDTSFLNFLFSVEAIHLFVDKFDIN